MRIAIVEDEELVAEELENMLTSIDDQITIVAQLDSVKSATFWLQNNTADLLFLDINLGDGNSFSIFEKVEIDTPVIFTTAYDEYAIKAFDVNSIDFLLKPIDEDDLRKALDKVENMRKVLSSSAKRNDETDFTPSYKKRFLAVGVKKMYSIPIAEIAYFRADGKTVFLIDNAGKNHIVESTLKDINEQLDPQLFFRINRKMIINYNAIQSIVSFSKNRKKVLLTPELSDPLESIVSLEKNKDFLIWLDQ